MRLRAEDHPRPNRGDLQGALPWARVGQRVDRRLMWEALDERAQPSPTRPSHALAERAPDRPEEADVRRNAPKSSLSKKTAVGAGRAFMQVAGAAISAVFLMR